MNNARLSQSLRELAELKIAAGEPEEQVKRLQRVAFAVSRLTEPATVLAHTGRLSEIPGVGTVTANLICEYLTDGDSRERRKLAHRIPETVLEMMTIPGIGAQTALGIYKKTHLARISEFCAALRENRLPPLPSSTLARLRRHFRAEEVASPQGKLIF